MLGIFIFLSIVLVIGGVLLAIILRRYKKHN
jgi:hypothetical protein